jgi:hypothetical protein
MVRGDENGLEVPLEELLTLKGILRGFPDSDP